jgi:hypothetical protein
MLTDDNKPLISASDAAEAGGRRSTEPRALQRQMDWAPDGSVVLTEADANRSPRSPITRSTLRGDARRTAEYLASRGTTPVEALHDVVKLGWKRGVREIARELGCSKQLAMPIWLRCVESLLPYAAAKFETLELGPQAAQGLAIGHFMAARAMSEALARERDGGRESGRDSALRGGHAGGSIVRNTIDLPGGLDLPLPDNGLSEGTERSTETIRAALPPKAPD